MVGLIIAIADLDEENEELATYLVDVYESGRRIAVEDDPRDMLTEMGRQMFRGKPFGVRLDYPTAFKPSGPSALSQMLDELCLEAIERYSKKEFAAVQRRIEALMDVADSEERIEEAKRHAQEIADMKEACTQEVKKRPYNNETLHRGFVVRPLGPIFWDLHARQGAVFE